jgi:predicted secreted protein
VVGPARFNLASEAASPISEATEPGVGRPIVQIFIFEAHRRGAGILLLRYVRSWEKSAPDEEQYQIHVLIE